MYGVLRSSTVLTSPWVPHHLTNPSDGAAIDLPDLATVGVSLPASAWFVCVWVFIVSMSLTDDNKVLLSVTSGANDPLVFIWNPNEFFIKQGTYGSSVQLSRATGKWFMVSMGSNNNGVTGGIVATKGSYGQQVNWSPLTPLTLESPASVKAPVGPGDFDVTHM